MEKVRIKQATRKGYAEVGEYGCFDMSYPDSDTRRGRVQENGDVTPTLTAQNIEIGVVVPSVLTRKRTEYGKMVRKDYEKGKIKEKRKNMARWEPRSDEVANTITSVQKDNMLCEPVIGALRGRNPDKPTDRTAGLPTQQMLEIKDDGTSNTLTTVQKDNVVCEPSEIMEGYRIRKLTELECWRLMGFSDDDFDKAANVNSRSQLYKQAGNSIVVNVLMEIFKNML